MAEAKEETVEALFAKLEKSDAKSLLKKYLTKEVFEKLKDKKTKQGCDLKSCIRSGIDNLDSGVGVYASDWEAYTLFADLLNPVIKDYHKLDTLDGFKHPKQNFSFDDKFTADLDPEGKYIISTRVRVARNVIGYPLRGGMNSAQTMELEAKLKEILEGFEDEELKGTYYPLKGMDEKTRQQLVDDHFLFKKGDRFLDSAGINRDWPNGRGIFFNTAKTFLVWVNEEDQLRIISMQQGANIKAVFGRLEKAVAAINAKLEFAYNEQLGYLTACPTNIGCGERASVHIKVPLTSQKKDVFDAIAKKHNLQIRGVHGEHSESKGGIYDVSNKRRLGISEWDGVKDLINGCQELMETEARLAGEGTEEKQEENEEKKEESIDALYAKLAASDAKSLLKKYLTKEIFEKLKDKVTSQGCDFKSSIRSGIDNLDSGVGVYASDYEAYTLFADLLNPIIIDYHKLGSLDGFKHPKQNFAFDDKMVANVDPEGKFVVSTRIRVARNVQGYPLRGGMSAKQTMELEAKLKAILEGFEDEDLKGKYYPLKGMDEKTRQQLVDDHFLFKKGDRFLHSAGINNNWPDGRGIFFNTAKTFLVWVNEEDQLRIISMQQGANIKAVFGRLEKAVAAINAKLEFAYNEQLGYLTACPTNIGCGERASVHIKVPLTSQKKDVFDAIAKKHNLQIRGVHGEHSESKGGIYDVSNKRRLGISEWDGVKDLINGCQELMETEARLAGEEENKEENKEEEKEESIDALYAKLAASDAKSLLKKYLTKEIFEKLKDKVTSQGCDFKSSIRSGIDNLDSGVGVYASDYEAYTLFADLLNPIIIDYHKLGSLDGFKHPKQNFAFDDKMVANVDPEGKFVVSTRIRVARNVQGYPLRGGMSAKQTMELEAKLKAILEGFEDEDLKGKYYPLKGMDEKTRQQLVDDHFLFKKGDRFLHSAGINNNWPDGRGIFFNNAKTFLVWVNEEDQLRIISMEQGANIKSVFGRLEKAVAAINAKLEFAYNEQLGYLTACPTNIGCGERASVHIKVPLTSQNKEAFDAIAKKHNLQIRGVHGEHSESKGGVYDVSNKRRLGITEWDGVKDLINGCKDLIESETKLQKAQK